MRLSNKNKAVIKASELGYRVSKCGTRVRGLRVKHVKLQYIKKYGKKYKAFTVRIDSGAKVSCLVHKLQAFQKFGESAFAFGMVVRHLNDNSLHNNWDNIAIGTQAENMLDKAKNNDNCPF